METKFQVGQELQTPRPGWTGTVVMIDIFAKRYLLDCHPGAMANYVWLKVPEGVLPHTGGVLAGNWFHEDELSKIDDEAVAESRQGSAETQQMVAEMFADIVAVKEMITKLAEPDGDAIYCCQNCSYRDEEAEFWPSDGNPAPHVCPQCGSSGDVFPVS